MLEGKEAEGLIGKDGNYSVDVDQYGMVRAEASYEIDGVRSGAFIELSIIDVLKKLALKTDSLIDDNAVLFIEGLLAKKDA